MRAIDELVVKSYPVVAGITTYRAWTFATAASASGSVNAPA